MNNSCCVSDSSRLHLQRYDIRQGRIAHFGSRWFTFVLFGSLWFKMVLFRLCHIWWSLTSYMMIAYVIYDDCLRHIWYLPASYMMQAHAVYGVGWCHIGCRLMPDMPLASTLYADVWTHLSWRCYTLGEWVVFMLPFRRETATISANGGGWSYTLSERRNAKCLIIRWIDLKKCPLYYTIYSNIYTLLYFLYYT